MALFGMWGLSRACSPASRRRQGHSSELATGSSWSPEGEQVITRRKHMEKVLELISWLAHSKKEKET